MGVIYKFKKEIIDYIIEKKKKDPAISCRNLVSLIRQEFNKKVSKSSINAVIKETGLSMPVGRRRVLEQGSYEFESAGIFFLKAADYLLGGSLSIAETINKCLGFDDPKILNKIEYLIYSNSLSGTENRGVKNNLLGADFNEEDISAYLLHLQSVKELSPRIVKVILGISKGVRALKLNLTDKSVVYLDGQGHAVWSLAKIPNSFFTTYYDAKRYTNKFFLENSPITLFVSPGYDAPTKEFFDFISFLNGQKSISSITLLDNNLTEIETIRPQDSSLKHFVIFGIWPWQFGQCREIKSIGKFKPFCFMPANKSYYIAETTIELSQPNVNKRVMLNGCVLKKSLKGKEILTIYTNFSFDQLKPEEITAMYLNKWPNLEEGFINFSRSIENFTRGTKNEGVIASERSERSNPESCEDEIRGNLFKMASSPRLEVSGLFAMTQLFHKAGPQGINCNEDLSIKDLLSSYLTMLDSFVKMSFLPAEYEKDTFSTIKDRFYGLKGVFTTKKNEVIIKFCPPSSYPNIKELEYACNRVNERNVFIGSGKKLWLVV